MKALHVKTSRIRNEERASALSRALSAVNGVVQVAIVRSAGVVSVLFDDTVANATEILRAVRSLGYDARLVYG